MDVQIDIFVGEDDRETTEFASTVTVSPAALDKVLFDFNSAGDSRVTKIKALHAALIQEMLDLQASSTSTPAQVRCAAIAITELEGTQMRAVKALFAKA